MKKTAYIHLCLRNRYVMMGTYEVIAENEYGEAKEAVKVQVLDRPGYPATCNVVEITKSSMTVVFKPPADNGGNEITNYIIERREAGRQVWSKLSTTIAPE